LENHGQESDVGSAIKLSGGEITLLKALGLGGTPVSGKQLIDRLGMAEGEMLDTINGMINQGYIVSSKVNVQKMEDIERSYFRVDAAASRNLRAAMRPARHKEEERPRRRRG
jgi:biotin operon repressor